MLHPRSIAGYLTIILVGSLLALAVTVYAQREFEAARALYVKQATTDAQQGAHRLDSAIRTIYENLKTLASLPSLRSIDRHGNNLSEEARTTFQQIYANLAANVDVSEVYIVPASFNPDRLDPATGKAEEPILMFDSLIVNAASRELEAGTWKHPLSLEVPPPPGPPEVETDEYRQLTDHLSYLAGNFPSERSIAAFVTPMVSGPEVITCDNTEFINSHRDADRKGVLFSVPFYGPDAKLKGTVTAIILSNALRRLLPNDNYVLINPGNRYVSARSGSRTLLNSRPFIERGVPDPGLIFSTIVPLSTFDPRSPWAVWVGRDDQDFYGTTGIWALRLLEVAAYGLVALLTFGALFGWYVVRRDITRERNANVQLSRARDEARTAETMALRAEAEAREMAQSFHQLNQDVTRLNLELAAKMRDLQEAQAENLKRGKMAQLGQLTATVAHELRNPMAAIRNTAFVVRRRLAGLGPDVEAQLQRIDSGIARCDDIISQLLDFARDKAPDLEPTDIDAWLIAVAEEEAQVMPPAVEVRVVAGLGGASAEIDPRRLRRMVTNLLANACEAMVGRDGKATPLRPPVVTIATRPSKRGIEIVFSDTGPGIPTELLSKIREPLFTTKNFGTGLGIPAVERILQLHGGGLDIASEEGKGATFTAWFPVRQSATSAA